MKGPGLKPPTSGMFRKEVIGPTDCPILHRWTPLNLGSRVGKVMVHRFLPNADDRDVHDHPSPFVTFVLRGSYQDLVPCATCRGEGIRLPDDYPCGACGARGLVAGDHMRPGMLRYRRARYAHRTKVGPNGCWTLVFMGPKIRPWGFWRGGRWWPWREYEEHFGFGMRCETEEGSD